MDLRHRSLGLSHRSVEPRHRATQRLGSRPEVAGAGGGPDARQRESESATRLRVAGALRFLGVAAPDPGAVCRDVEHVIEPVGHVKVRFDLVDRLLVLRLKRGLAEGSIRGEEQADGMRVLHTGRARGTDVDVDRLVPHRLDVVQIAARDVVPPRGVGGPDLHEPGVGAAAPVGAEVIAMRHAIAMQHPALHAVSALVHRATHHFCRIARHVPSRRGQTPRDDPCYADQAKYKLAGRETTLREMQRRRNGREARFAQGFVLDGDSLFTVSTANRQV